MSRLWGLGASEVPVEGDGGSLAGSEGVNSQQRGQREVGEGLGQSPWLRGYASLALSHRCSDLVLDRIEKVREDPGLPLFQAGGPRRG